MCFHYFGLRHRAQLTWKVQTRRRSTFSQTEHACDKRFRCVTTLLNRTSRSVRLTSAKFCTPVSCCQARPGSLASGLHHTSFQYHEVCSRHPQGTSSQTDTSSLLVPSRTRCLRSLYCSGVGRNPRPTKTISTSCRKRSMDSGKFAPSRTRCGAHCPYFLPKQLDEKVACDSESSENRGSPTGPARLQDRRRGPARTIHRDSPETIQVDRFGFLIEWMTCPSRQ